MAVRASDANVYGSRSRGGGQRRRSWTPRQWRPKAATAEAAENAERVTESHLRIAAALQKLQQPGPIAMGSVVLGRKYSGRGLATSSDMHPIDEVTDQVISAAIKVHKALGPGLLESVYNAALGVELVAMGLEVHVGKPISLDYEGLHLKRAYVVDLLVNNCVVVELKCVQKLTPVDVAQLLTYLRLLDIRVGLLINFNVTLLKHGIRRVVNRHVDEQGNKLPVSGKTATVDEVKERIDDNEPTKSPPRLLRPLRLPPSDANDAE